MKKISIDLQFGLIVAVLVVFAIAGTILSQDEKSVATSTATPTPTAVITIAYTNVRNFANYVNNESQSNYTFGLGIK